MSDKEQATVSVSVPESNFLIQYTKQRKKTRLFMATTLIAVIAFGATLGVYLTNPKTEKAKVETTQGPNGEFRFRDGNGTPPEGIPEGGPGGGMMRDITSFFNEDKTVDTEAVEQLTENVPDDFKDRILENLSTQIEKAVTDGDITSDQAAALKSALGI